MAKMEHIMLVCYMHFINKNGENGKKNTNRYFSKRDVQLGLKT